MEKYLKTCGIIAEYNPFHNGHRYQIEKAREQSKADVMVAVMSGNFVQRGEPAIVDKFKRASAAIENGIDVVLELPYYAATQSATGFAHGAVDICKKAKIDALCFGSECGNLENLQEIAATSINPDNLREALSKGMSYARSYSLLTAEMQPNDILGVSYLKELQGSSIEPLLVQRTNGYLDDTLSDLASAFAIRKALFEQQDVTLATPMADVLCQSELVSLEMFYPYLRTFLCMSEKGTLSQYFLCNEGIESHLMKNAMKYEKFADFLSGCVTHRYTASRIRRTILQIMMQFTKLEYAEVKDQVSLRVLAMNDTGRLWLRQLHEMEIPVVSKFADLPEKQRQIAYRSALLYSSALSEPERQRILKEEIRGARYLSSK